MIIVFAKLIELTRSVLDMEQKRINPIKKKVIDIILSGKHISGDINQDRRSIIRDVITYCLT